MSTTLTTPSTMDSLIDGFRAHMLGRPLPTPALVSFMPSQGEVSIQPGGLNFPLKLGNILLWAYTLADTTAKWAHTASGRLHVEARGRTTSGVRIEVYAGTDFADCDGLVPLRPGESEGVSLDELYTLAGLLREVP
jgi:hypothetical protein